MSSAKELREARRRKILERGGDRLAYITGQVKTLPPVEPSAVGSPPGESGLKSLSIAGELPSSSEGEFALFSRLSVVSSAESFDFLEFWWRVCRVLNLGFTVDKLGI